MTSRDCVKAAIEHRNADRVPFCISLCAETYDAMKEAIGENAAGHQLARRGGAGTSSAPIGRGWLHRRRRRR